MKLSLPTTAQWFKVGKATLWVGASAALSYLITETTNNQELFGVLTPTINIILVTLKQLVTKG